MGLAKRHLVEVQQPSSTRDGAGQPVDTWTTVAEVHASIQHKGGREIDQPSGEHGRVMTLFRFWYQVELDALAPDWRIKHGNRVYDIQGVNNVFERNREFEVTAQHDATA